MAQSAQQGLSHSPTLSIQFWKRSRGYDKSTDSFRYPANDRPLFKRRHRSSTDGEPQQNQESNRTPGFTGGFRFGLLAQARPSRRAGFALMPSRSYANANASDLTISPMAAGPTLPVVGFGTVGRLTKWTGITSSNSFIGDSTIFESK